MNKLYQEGNEAYWKGIGVTECPYLQDPQKDEWEIGWLSAYNDDIQSEYFGEYYPGFDDKHEN